MALPRILKPDESRLLLFYLKLGADALLLRGECRAGVERSRAELSRVALSQAEPSWVQCIYVCVCV